MRILTHNFNLDMETLLTCLICHIYNLATEFWHCVKDVVKVGWVKIGLGDRRLAYTCSDIEVFEYSQLSFILQLPKKDALHNAV